MNTISKQVENSSANNTVLSRHAETRIRQRGFTKSNLDLIRSVGEAVNDGYVMTDHAIAQHLQALHLEMSRIERLRGVALIEGDEKVVTIYHADKARIRRLRSDRRHCA
jgi:hypothetical protein